MRCLLVLLCTSKMIANGTNYTLPYPFERVNAFNYTAVINKFKVNKVPPTSSTYEYPNQDDIFPVAPSVVPKTTEFPDNSSDNFEPDEINDSLLYYPSVGVTSKKDILLGYITGSKRLPHDREYKRPGLLISGAITLAVDEINTLHPLAKGYQLKFVAAETFGQENRSILQTALLWNQKVSAYIGPQETCLYEARMAASFDIPMISYFCTHPRTSNKDKFPTFARTRPPETQISKSVASVLKKFNWNTVTFLYNNSPDEGFGPVAKTILSTLVAHNITVKATKAWNSTHYHAYMDNIFVDILRDTYIDCRIYVVLGIYYEFIGIMSTLEEQGLFKNGEYFVVGVMLQEYNHLKPEQYLRDFLTEKTNATLQKAFQNFIGVIPTASVASEKFHDKVDAYLQRPPFNFPNVVSPLGGRKMIRPEAFYLYDAVYLYAKSLNETLQNGEEPSNTTAIMQRILATSYTSAKGYVVHIDQHGDAEGNYTLVARYPHHSRKKEFGLYPAGVFRYSDGYKGLPELHLTSDINWKTGFTPIDEPVCGFHNERCQSQTGEIIAGITGGIMLVVGVCLLVIYRNWRYEQELDSLMWKIDFKDIQLQEFPPPNNNFQAYSREKSHLSTINSEAHSSQLSLSSTTDGDAKSMGAIYTQLGVHKGQIVAAKRLFCRTLDITRCVKKELKTMRDLRHDHLLAFIGACVEPHNVCIVTEYCSRGSLKDILENDDVQLDQMFLASLIGDIVQGMIYLHDSPIKSHGNLKSANCLVDSRWVVKISDFGLHALKTDPHRLNITRGNYHDLLYRAPELLRNENSPPEGTQKGDIFSFSIILYEIHSRSFPYDDTNYSLPNIVQLIKNGPSHGQLLRPLISHLDACADCVRSVLIECWAEQPEERPDFRTIRQKLRPMRKGMKPNIFDNMLDLMEKYANNLEALVDERTDLLNEEKKKTDALLYEMLPRCVAEQLKKGCGVEAENYECVSIYFSDIVGFTEMSAQSTALEVVGFLNDLYTCFDSIIGNYDVYKVETIGDAYMVVSGLPIRNGNEHAVEIASLSLHLLSAVKKFKIRHRPADTLKLRIGLHSGPVCAGVVGVKMPRYCLFGDTVNTASRMESLGAPLMIHCSTAFHDILNQTGGYTFESRGNIKVKGKGEMETYWLTGEDLIMKQRREKERQSKLSPNLKPPATIIGGLRGSTKSVLSQKNRSINSNTRTDCEESPKNQIQIPETKDNHRTNKMTTYDYLEKTPKKRNSLPCFKYVKEKSPVTRPSLRMSPLLSTLKDETKNFKDNFIQSVTDPRSSVSSSTVPLYPLDEIFHRLKSSGNSVSSNSKFPLVSPSIVSKEEHPLLRHVASSNNLHSNEHIETNLSSNIHALSYTNLESLFTYRSNINSSNSLKKIFRSSQPCESTSLMLACRELSNCVGDN